MKQKRLKGLARYDIEFYALVIAIIEYLAIHADDEEAAILNDHLTTANRKLYNAQQKERYEKRS